MKPPYPESNEYIENPKGMTLNNIWCWSKSDSYPKCKTIFLAANDSILLTVENIDSDIKVHNQITMKSCSKSFIGNECIFDSILFKQNIDKSEWLPKADSLLMLRLGDRVNILESIKLIKDEETDRLWAVFEGIGIGAMVGVIAMIIELPVSSFTKSEYNWNHVLYSGFGVATGYSIIRYATYDTNPRSLRIRIDLKRF